MSATQSALVERVRTAHLAAGLKATLLAMLNFDPRGEDVWASMQWLAFESGVTPRTVRRHIGILRRLGVLIVAAPSHSINPAGKYRKTVTYRIDPSAIIERPVRREVMQEFEAYKRESQLIDETLRRLEEL